MGTGKVQKLIGSYTFRIERYSGLSTQVGTSTESPEFDLCGHIWQLRIFPGGSLELHKGYLSYYLASKSTRQARASYRLSVLNQLNSSLDSQQAQSSSKDESFSSSGVRVFEAKGLQVDGWGRDKFMTVATLLEPTAGFCVDDTVIFRVFITVYGDMEICTFPVMNNTNNDFAHASLAKDMHSLLKDETDSMDVTLIVGECQERICAHRCVLRARSPVFAAMLGTGGPPSVLKRKSQNSKCKMLRTRICELEEENQRLANACAEFGNSIQASKSDFTNDVLLPIDSLRKACREHRYAEEKDALGMMNGSLACFQDESGSLPSLTSCAAVSWPSTQACVDSSEKLRRGMTHRFRSISLSSQSFSAISAASRTHTHMTVSSASNHNDVNEDSNSSITGSDAGINYSDDDSECEEYLYLSAPFQEGRLGEVIISDIRPEIMRELLLFMYTDACSSISIFSDHAVELFEASAKYQVQALFAFIEKYLCMEVGIHNCLALLQLADMYDAVRLLNKAAQVVHDNALSTSAEFNSLPKHLRSLVLATMDPLLTASCCTSGGSSAATMSVDSVSSTATHDNTNNAEHAGENQGRVVPNNRNCTIS